MEHYSKFRRICCTRNRDTEKLFSTVQRPKSKKSYEASYVGRIVRKNLLPFANLAILGEKFHSCFSQINWFSGRVLWFLAATRSKKLNKGLEK